MTANQPPTKLRVAVLMGGTSSERPISLSTGNMIAAALDRDRYEVTTIDTQDILALRGPHTAQPTLPHPNQASPAGLGQTLPAEIAPIGGQEIEHAADAQPYSVVFIALHGKGGEDGTIQGLLELIGLPYTGSGVLASALAMDKSMSKRLFRSAGIPVIPDIVLSRADNLSNLCRRVETELNGCPVFVKPNAEGSTFGCTLVQRPDDLPNAVTKALHYDETAIIEQYIQGTEITVGVLDQPTMPPRPEALPIIEIVPKSAYYDYESKYAAGGSDHIIPARLPAALTEEARNLALRCHNLLGCRGMSRTDMIVRNNQIYVLEVNTIPGMTPTSLLPQAAEHAGIPFPELLDRLIACALPRTTTPVTQP